MNNQESDERGDDEISSLLLECLLNEELSIEERLRRAREVAAAVLKERNGECS